MRRGYNIIRGLFLVSQACRGIFRKAASKTAPFFLNDVLMPLDTAFTVCFPVAGVLHRFAQVEVIETEGICGPVTLFPRGHGSSHGESGKKSFVIDGLHAEKSARRRPKALRYAQILQRILRLTLRPY
jgi:hypothetical protein